MIVKVGEMILISKISDYTINELEFVLHLVNYSHVLTNLDLVEVNL